MKRFTEWTALGGFVWRVASAMALLSLGCAPHQPAVLTPPAAMAAAVPPAWPEQLAFNELVIDLRRCFDDPALAVFIDQTLAANPDLAATALRLQAAGLLTRAAAVGDRPRLDGSLESGRNNQQLDVVTGETTLATLIQPTLSLSWELDLWGKLADRRHGETMRLAAQAADYAALRDALIARVIQAWLNAGLQQRLLQVEQQRLAMLTDIEAIHRERYRNGLARFDEAASARVAVALARAAIETRRGQLQQARRDLAVLSGRPSLQSPEAPHAPAPIRLAAPPLPAEVLLRRPDVRAAMVRVEAARAGAAVADKNRYPSLKLSGQVFRQGATLSALGGAGTGWNLLGALFQPLLDHGALAKAARAEHLEAEAVVHDLYATLWRALHEVTQALEQERFLVRQIEETLLAEAEAARSSAFYAARYRQGLDPLPFLLRAREQEIEVAIQRESLMVAHWMNRLELVLAAGLGEAARPWLAVHPEQNEVATATMRRNQGRGGRHE